MFQKSLFVLLSVVLLAVGGTLYENYREADRMANETAEKLPSAPASSPISVYVTGAVRTPGMVTLDSGARVADAVELCGGLLPNADPNTLNLAQILADGAQIRVGEKIVASTASDGARKQTASAVSAIDASGKLVNINTADAAELDTLPGIGPAIAQKIIDYRQNEGAFIVPEDIKKVRGIGQAKYEKLKDLITT